MTDWSVHTYTAADSGLFVNSYLLETPAGVVVIDTNLLASDISALKLRLAALHKPLLGVFITHAHPDHFNGTFDLVSDREVPVYATNGVAKAIREIADAKRAQWGPVYGNEWPAATYYPNTELSDEQRILIEDLTITVRELGAGESHADSYLLVRRPGGKDLAFIGDLAFHGTHSYTADGHVAAWLGTLDRVADELSGFDCLLPGHGAPAGPELFAEQRRYLMHYREVVRRLAGGATRLTDADKEELQGIMQSFLPGAPLTWMVGLGADSVAAELAAASGTVSAVGATGRSHDGAGT